ncbi:hypothetical protein PVK06_047086 [Gossypium arboreum]|uniref:RNase H type-1 domain-containing protein n=1 Tax=Gossypium arboreum TaxID=29729 RepID=A0ABR0MCH8_GOSAR|nr:hypothetical protein PVK06_047086 [Gossypium arboreum]
MALDVEIVVIGWDLSLGVQSRRALALSSVWLHKGGEGEKGGNFYGSWAPGNRLWDVRDKSGYANGIDLVLGINLEENSTSSLQWGGNSSTGQDRDKSWSFLKSLYGTEGILWFAYWDFNEIMYGVEKKGGLPRDERRMEVFQNVLEDCHLMDIQLNFEIEKDELYWEQRARVNWLKLGDRNTSFFHSQRHNHGEEISFVKCWIESLMKCVSTVSYSVAFNGHVGEKFRPTRRLRQGDPLSPFLFLICGDGLSSLMRLAMREGLLRGVKASRSGPQEEERRMVASILGVRRSNDLEHYLGFPNMFGRGQQSHFSTLPYNNREAHAGLQVVQLGISMGFNSLAIMGDSRTVIRDIQSKKRCEEATNLWNPTVDVDWIRN